MSRRNQSVRTTILVAADRECDRNFLREILAPEDLYVIAAEDGADAWGQFTRFRPDVVLLDVALPVVGGLDLCRRIKQSPEGPSTPVILITGESSGEDRARSIDAGADDFIASPVDRIEVLARMRSLLRWKVSMQELEWTRFVLCDLCDLMHSMEVEDIPAKRHTSWLLPVEKLAGIREEVSRHCLQPEIARKFGDLPTEFKRESGRERRLSSANRRGTPWSQIGHA
jgi:CheY-like chemotaxis protein